MKLKIPAVDGKIVDEKIARIIAEKTIVEDEDGNKKTTVKDWIVRGDHVIVEVERFAEELTEEEKEIVERYKA